MSVPAPRQTLQFESIDEFRAILAQLDDIGEIRQIHDLAEAARRYAQTAEQQRRAVEAKLWAAYRGGELLAENPDYGRGKKSLRLSDLGIEDNQASRWQKLYAKTAAWLEDYLSVVDEPTMAGALATTDLGGLKQSVTVEWYTPARYIEAARTVLGGIDLDPASSELANETVQATEVFTEEMDGLGAEWHGRVWLNPPYGKGSGLFTTKLVGEYAGGRVEAAILLLNAYGFDSSWFQPLWRHPICFTDHRIEFWSPQRGSGGPANANIFVYLGPHERQFADVFFTFGTVVKTWLP